MSSRESSTVPEKKVCNIAGTDKQIIMIDDSETSTGMEREGSGPDKEPERGNDDMSGNEDGAESDTKASPIEKGKKNAGGSSKPKLIKTKWQHCNREMTKLYDKVIGAIKEQPCWMAVFHGKLDEEIRAEINDPVAKTTSILSKSKPYKRINKVATKALKDGNESDTEGIEATGQDGTPTETVNESQLWVVALRSVALVRSGSLELCFHADEIMKQIVSDMASIFQSVESGNGFPHGAVGKVYAVFHPKVVYMTKAAQERIQKTPGSKALHINTTRKRVLSNSSEVTKPVVKRRKAKSVASTHDQPETEHSPERTETEHTPQPSLSKMRILVKQTQSLEQRRRQNDNLITELGQTKSKLQTMQNSLTASEERRKALESERASNLAELEILRNSTVQQDSKRALNNLQTELNSTKEQLGTSQQRCRELEDTQEKQSLKVAILQNEISRLQKDVDKGQSSLTKERTHLQDQLENSDARCERLRTERNFANTKLKAIPELQKSLKAAQDQTKQLKEQSDKNETAIEHLRRDLNSSKAEVASLLERNADVSEKLKQAEQAATQKSSRADLRGVERASPEEVQKRITGYNERLGEMKPDMQSKAVERTTRWWMGLPGADKRAMADSYVVELGEEELNA